MEVEKICGIYKITSPKGRIYIGQGINLKKRFSDYNSSSCKGQIRLYNSLKKYGVENHQFDIIEYCAEEDLNCSERFWQDEFDVTGDMGLNCMLVECGEKRKIYSQESREKMRKSQIGKKASEATKQKMRDSARKGENHQNYGKVITEEHKKKISDANKGSNHLVGIIRSEETKQKIREAFSKMVICLETGIFYTSAKEAAKVYNINYSTLNKYLTNKRTNKTNLIYA